MYNEICHAYLCIARMALGNVLIRQPLEKRDTEIVKMHDYLFTITPDDKVNESHLLIALADLATTDMPRDVAEWSEMAAAYLRIAARKLEPKY